MNAVMLRVSDAGVERLDANGWREMGSEEFVEIDGGNHITVNADGLAVGRIQGAGAMLIVCLVVLAVFGAAVG